MAVVQILAVRARLHGDFSTKRGPRGCESWRAGSLTGEIRQRGRRQRQRPQCSHRPALGDGGLIEASVRCSWTPMFRCYQ